MSGVNVEFYKAQVLKWFDVMDQRLLTNDYVKLIQEKTQVRPSFLAVGLGTFAVLFLVWGVGAQFVTNLVGFVYPLYESYRSLHAASSASAVHSQPQWLTYWVIYALFSLIESLTDFFLLWIPLYPLVKVAFLVWCFYPTTHGAEQIYHKVVEPVLARFEGRIDSVGRETKRAASRVISEVVDDAVLTAAEVQQANNAASSTS